MPYPANAATAVAAFLEFELGAGNEENQKEALSPLPRVFRPRLPEWAEPLMPEGLKGSKGAVVLSHAGGGQLFTATWLPIMDTILDLTCYGSSLLQADELAQEVQLALYYLRQSTWEGTQLKYARIVAGPTAEYDTHTDWPESVLSIQVTHSIRSQVAD